MSNSIGMAVVVIPFNHPLRTASDFALVDVLAERGAVPREAARALRAGAKVNDVHVSAGCLPTAHAPLPTADCAQFRNGFPVFSVC